MATRRLSIGSLVKNKNPEKGDYVKINLPKGMETVTLKNGQFLNFETKKFKQQDIERRVAGGYLTEDKAALARAAVGKIPDFVRGELVVVLPKDEE